MTKIGNGSIPIRVGNLINTTVYGGAYRQIPPGFWGVKMAAEIDHPHKVSVPTRDFCVPNTQDLQQGLVKALMAMINNEDVYVGCMGGIGRTGLFLAALAKIQMEYRKVKHRPGGGDNPVLYVRKHFIPHAVETTEQVSFIETLDVSKIIDWLDYTQSAMGLSGFTQASRRDPEPLPTLAEVAKASWKTSREDISKKGFMERIEAGLEADSADAYLVQEDGAIEYQEQIDSLQDQLDDMQDVVAKLVVANGQRVEDIGKVYQDVSKVAQKLRNTLTKPTVFERIVRWFKD